MKNLKFLIVGITLFSLSVIHSQVSVNVNIGTPPVWGSSNSINARYYYLPDIESYYDINSSMFLYISPRGNWIRSRNLPRQYRNYDLYNAPKVVINNYFGATPYTYYKKHSPHYSKPYRNDYYVHYDKHYNKNYSNHKGKGYYKQNNREHKRN